MEYIGVQDAAEIRAFRLPEPYKSEGVKYSDERIFRKEGYEEVRRDSNGIAMATKHAERRKARIRRTIKAVAGAWLRLSVFRFSKHIYAQVIDDRKGATRASASSLE